MSSKSIKSAFKYTLSLAFAGLLFWWVYRGMDFRQLIGEILEADYRWVLLSIFLSFFGNLARAYRWNLLLEPLGYSPPLGKTFMALMIGYFANIFAPRLGEVTRCGVLKKTEGVSFTASIGTVVTERLVDLLTLFILIGGAFFLEYNRLSGFFSNYFSAKASEVNLGLIGLLLIAFLVLVGVVWLIWKVNQEAIKSRPFYLKFRALLLELIQGLTSIVRMKKASLFVFSTIFMWTIYYFMGYVVFSALPTTENLGFIAGFSILVVGALGMSAPVQGGIGTFHAFVASCLLLYGVSNSGGKSFAFLLHTSQLITMLVVGGISLLISFIIQRKQTNPAIADAE